MNTCVTCKHHRANSGTIEHECYHPIAIDPVTGERGLSCSDVRRFHGCRVEGQWWSADVSRFDRDPPIVPLPQPPEAA